MSCHANYVTNWVLPNFTPMMNNICGFFRPTTPMDSFALGMWLFDQASKMLVSLALSLEQIAPFQLVERMGNGCAGQFSPL